MLGSREQVVFLLTISELSVRDPNPDYRVPSVRDPNPHYRVPKGIRTIERFDWIEPEDKSIEIFERS